MIVFIIILWYCVAILCLTCINESYTTEKEWLEMPVWQRTLYLSILPVIYLGLGAWKAFEK